MLRTIALERLRIVRLPDDWSRWIVALLFAALAVQSARLLWALVTPAGPVGDWRPALPPALGTPAQAAIFASANPFATATAGSAAALPSDLKLYGVRAAFGGLAGGAIMQLPDGAQVSVSVGEEVMPGVTLAAVGFDFAEVARGAVRQRLFLDPDKAPEAISQGVASSPAPALEGMALREAFSLTPRMAGTAVTGIVVAPGTNTELFSRSGLQAGDVIVAVNGAAIQSTQDLAQLQRELGSAGSLSLAVDRGGRRIPITLNLASSR